MASRVFFSYHFQRDAWRANQVRQSWVTKTDREAAGFFDAADQEEVQRTTDKAIKRWIDQQLQHTSVTAVLIGRETADREYVRYEIERSFERGNALLGIWIHNLKNRSRQTDHPGDNPLDDYVVETGSMRTRLSDLFPTYDWMGDDGQRNVADWIEESADVNQEVPRHWRDSLARAEDGELLDLAVKGAAGAVGLIIASELAENISEYLEQRSRRKYR